MNSRTHDTRGKYLDTSRQKQDVEISTGETETREPTTPTTITWTTVFERREEIKIRINLI